MRGLIKIKSGKIRFLVLFSVLIVFSNMSVASVSVIANNPCSESQLDTEKTVAVIHGSFTIKNSPPTLTEIAILENTSHYSLKIDVADRNSLRDIKEILVTIKTNTSDSSEDDDMDSDTYEDAEMEEVIYQWTPTGGWELRTHKGKWGIDAPGSKEPDDLTVSSGTWWLCFIPDDDDVEDSYWDISVEVQDSQATDDMTIWGYQMHWDDDKDFVLGIFPEWLIF